MQRFVELYEALDETNSTGAKVQAMVRYFEDAPAADAAWCVYLLSGERLRSVVPARSLNEWTAQYAGVEDWMFDASYEAVGDKAETIALLIDAMPNRAVTNAWRPTLAEAVAWVKAQRGKSPEAQREALFAAWRGLEVRTLFLFMKLLTGGLRVGVAKRLLVRALSEWSGVPAHALFHRLMGNWQPGADSFLGLFSEDVSDADLSRPYPYFLASPLTDAAEELGEPQDWVAEYKWDGIRGQLVRRGNEVWLWSRGEELISQQFPEIIEAATALPQGTVIDGEVLAYQNGAPLPFAALQRRIGRKKVGPKMRADVPCVLMAYDLLEHDGQDIRARPLAERRALLNELLGHSMHFPISTEVSFTDWSELEAAREESRAMGVEGLMLKSVSSSYGVGRVRGDWWKWKVQPLEIDAVLLYAQPGHGRRAGLHTDYTFAVWDEDRQLVPVAKAYSGLDNKEIRELDNWIRDHTTDKFGPVRAVEPHHVFELHFENVAVSKRHKSGVAVRFPRIARWRRDRMPDNANTLADLQALIPTRTV